MPYNVFDRSCVEIDLDALKHNFEEIKKATTDGAGILAVVKADAYGHGAIEIAKTLIDSGAAGLCLATIDEAVELRKHGISVPMMTLGFTDPSRYKDAVKYDVEQSVYSYEVAKALSDEAVAQGKKLKIHVKLDTGMGRIGFKADGSETEAIAKSCALPGIEPYGVFSHFAAADTEDDDYTRQQFELFMNQVDELSKMGITFSKRHICNSAGILRFPEMHLDLVRAGIILYGLMPPGCPKPVKEINLKPVMNWFAKVIHVKTVPVGTTISYGRHFEAKRPTEVTTVGIGYADGLSRKLSNGFELVIGGKKCPIIGNICMDMCMVDTTDLETRPNVGDRVTVFGSERSADELAEALGTINYEITCDVGKRVRRLYVGG